MSFQFSADVLTFVQLYVDRKIPAPYHNGSCSSCLFIPTTHHERRLLGRRKTSAFQQTAVPLYIMSLYFIFFCFSAPSFSVLFFLHKCARWQDWIEITCSFQYYSLCLSVLWIKCCIHEPKESAVHRLCSKRPTFSSGKRLRARHLWSSTSVLQTDSCGRDPPSLHSLAQASAVPSVKDRHCSGDAGMVPRHIKMPSDMVWDGAQLLARVAS